MQVFLAFLILPEVFEIGIAIEAHQVYLVGWGDGVFNYHLLRRPYPKHKRPIVAADNGYRHTFKFIERFFLSWFYVDELGYVYHDYKSGAV